MFLHKVGSTFLARKVRLKLEPPLLISGVNGRPVGKNFVLAGVFTFASGAAESDILFKSVLRCLWLVAGTRLGRFRSSRKTQIRREVIFEAFVLQGQVSEEPRLGGECFIAEPTLALFGPIA